MILQIFPSAKMWNNGQQQATWWPNLSYSQFPAVNTQDEQVDESQQWAIRAAMWAQQKKMQEHFQQQVQLYQEQVISQSQKALAPPLPPDGGGEQPPPPPDGESRKPPLPPQGELLPPQVHDQKNHDDISHSSTLPFVPPSPSLDTTFRTQGIILGGDQAENQSNLVNNAELPFRRGQWKPFGSSSEEIVEANEDESFQHEHIHHHNHRNHLDDVPLDPHHNVHHRLDGNYIHGMPNQDHFHPHGGPFQDHGRHHHHGNHREHHVNNHMFHQPPPIDIIPHPAEGDPALMLPPPHLEHHSMDYFSGIPQLPPFAFPPSGEMSAPESFPPMSEDMLSLPGVDLSRKKGLPSWLREALDKHEKEKQKKQAKEKGLEDRGKSRMSLISGYQQQTSSGESSDEEKEQSDKKESGDQGPVDVNASPNGLENVAASSDSSEEEKEEEGKDVQIDLMQRIKKMVTEVLLNVTNAEIKSVACEVCSEAKRKALNVADQLQSSGGLDALRSAMGSYASSSEESEKEEVSGNNTRVDRHAGSAGRPVPMVKIEAAASSHSDTKPSNIKSSKAAVAKKQETSSSVSSRHSSASNSSDTSNSGDDSDSYKKSSSSDDESTQERSKGLHRSIHNRKEESRGGESDSPSSQDRRKKTKKGDSLHSQSKRSRKRSRSSSSESEKRKRRKSSKSRGKKTYRKERSSSDERDDKKYRRRDSSRHKERKEDRRTPEKTSRKAPSTSAKTKSTSKKKKKQDEDSDASSSRKSRKSSSIYKDRKKKRRSRSRSRSHSPRKKKR